jgi:glycosyltransferase involved in cell wall biosynthesis
MRERRLRVCFDARKCRDGGIGVYLRNAIYGLLQQPDIDLTLLTNDTELLTKSLGGLASYSSEGERRDPSDHRSRFAVQQVKATPFSLDELLFLGREVDWERFDLFHTPNYLLPFGVSCPSVITTHDLIHLKHPERAYYPLIAAPLMFSSLFRARRVVCVSNATRGDLLHMCRLVLPVKKKSVVIPNALSPSFTKREKNSELLRSRFNITSDFFLSVLSTVKPHKGVGDLLAAFQELEKKAEQTKGKVPQLVLVGQGTENLIKVERLLQSADSLRNFRLLGSVSEEELYQLYAGAKALIVPSFREGFCLPVIEAQSVETPVITRPIPAVLENISPRDVICEDFTVKGLVSGIERFLKNSANLDGDEGPLLEGWQEQFHERVDPVALGGRLVELYRELVGMKTGKEDEERFEQRVA